MIEVAGRQRRDTARQLERLGMRKLERRRVVEFGRLALDRLDDRIAVMAGIGAPQAGRAVDQLATIGCEIVHVLGANDQARTRLERPVGRERHPIGLEIVGNDRKQTCRRAYHWQYLRKSSREAPMTGRQANRESRSCETRSWAPRGTLAES